jgi:ABC-type transporter Mla subunit MlaD
MKLPLPELLAPRAVLGGAADAVETAFGLVPRAAAALTRVESLLDRVEAVVGRVERVVDLADETTARTDSLLDTAETVNTKASRAVDGSTGVLERIDTMLSTWEPQLRKLAPSMKKFAESLDPSEVAAAISLVDRLPVVLDHLENDVLPMLRQLDRVGPDLHEILEVVEDLRRVITGLPGVGLFRKRSEDEPPPIEDSVHGD